MNASGQFESDKSVKNEELKSLLAQSANPKKNKKKVKKAAAKTENSA